ncbi:sensor histidine kinase [Cerasicoccus maritimus]|uniref:sensor histidine kinase n=1 Tax=Cerasicoccus maritimus TaxID=490089 RepID=UPI002852A6E7|nr:HAMP domain-containing sensor histidine kinase [Cerasicoccus maritimus]
MKFRPILLAWLLLLGATLLMGAGAWWLLDREADRVDALANVSLANGAASVAENVDLLMDEIRKGVTEGLFVARQSPLPRNALSEFVANNPYVAAGFYFRGSDGVTSWYGARGNAPSPASLRASADGLYPWTMEVDEVKDFESEAEDLNALLKDKYNVQEEQQVTPSSKPMIQAPTDFILDNSMGLKESAKKQDAAPAPTENDYATNYSKSAELRRQRETVRQVNIATNTTVSQSQAPPVVAEPEAKAESQNFFSGLFSSRSERASEAPAAAPAEAFADADHVAAESGVSPSPPAALNEAYAATGNLAPQARGDAQQSSPSFGYARDELSEEQDFVGGDAFFVGNGQADQAFRFEALKESPEFVGFLAQMNDAARLATRSGWVMRDFDDAEQWLAWVDLANQENILGAWLNRETVLAEMAKTLSISQQQDVQFALVDDQGRRVTGAGGERYSSSERVGPALSLDVGASLPGWKIEAYPSVSGNPFGSGFRLLGGLTVAGLCVAILLGGSLLMWQSQRDALEAQRKTTFVANVSHELKTPLTSIRLFAEMLHDGRAGDEAKRQRYLQTMLNETQRLTRLVNNVLDFSRLERGRRDFNYAQEDVGVVIGEIVETQGPRLSGEGLDVEYTPPETPIRAKLDRDALEQILLNLLDNAAKYAADGKRAVVSAKAEPGGWSLSVCDFGLGIPARERQQVFAAFHRIDDRLTAERPGCGLGLSIAARLAEGLGGRLDLRPNEPTGCCFQLIVSEKDSAHG